MADVTPGPPGRSMDAKLDQLIMQAALDLVGEVGYDKVSMEAIATRARSSKATIYRRWDSKAALVTQALSCRHEATDEFPNTGDLRTDLIAALTLITTKFCAEDLLLMTGLLTSMRTDAELAVLVREQMITKKRAVWRELIARAVGRGQLLPTVDAGLVDDIAGAMIFMRLVVTGQPVDGPFIDHLVDSVLLPVLNHKSSPV